MSAVVASPTLAPTILSSILATAAGPGAFAPLTRMPSEQTTNEVVTVTFPSLTSFPELVQCQDNSILGPLPLDGVERAGTNVGAPPMPEPLLSKVASNSHTNSNYDDDSVSSQGSNQQCPKAHSSSYDQTIDAVGGATVWYAFQGTGETVGVSFCSVATETDLNVQAVLLANDGTFCNTDDTTLFVDGTNPDPDYFWWQCGAWSHTGSSSSSSSSSSHCSMLVTDTMDHQLYFLGVQGSYWAEGKFGMTLYSHYTGCETAMEWPADGTVTVLSSHANALNPVIQTTSSHGQSTWVTFVGTSPFVTIQVSGVTSTRNSQQVRLRTYRGSCEGEKLAFVSEDIIATMSSYGEIMEGLATIQTEPGVQYYTTISACSSHVCGNKGDILHVELSLHQATEECRATTTLQLDEDFVTGTLDVSDFGGGICAAKPFLGPQDWFSFEGNGDDATVILCLDGVVAGSEQQVPTLVSYTGSCANNTLTCLSTLNSYYYYSYRDRDSDNVQLFQESSLVNNCLVSHFITTQEDETYYLSAGLLQDSSSASLGFGTEGEYKISVLQKSLTTCQEASSLSPNVLVDALFTYSQDMEHHGFARGCGNRPTHSGQVIWYTFIGSGKTVQFSGDGMFSLEIFKGSCLEADDNPVCTTTGGFRGSSYYGYLDEGSKWTTREDQVYSVAIIAPAGNDYDFQLLMAEADNYICEQEVATGTTLVVGSSNQIKNVAGTVSHTSCSTTLGLAVLYWVKGTGDTIYLKARSNPGSASHDAGNVYVQVVRGNACSGNCRANLQVSDSYESSDYFSSTRGQFYPLIVLDTSYNARDDVNRTRLNVDFTLTVSASSTSMPISPPTLRPTSPPTPQPTLSNPNTSDLSTAESRNTAPTLTTETASNETSMILNETSDLATANPLANETSMLLNQTSKSSVLSVSLWSILSMTCCFLFGY